MTKEQKWNEAIAKACGWSAFHLETNRDPDAEEMVYLAGRHPKSTEKLGTENTWWRFADRVPNYCADLNAMREAEISGAIAYVPDYLFYLRQVVGGFPDAMSDWDDFRWWTAVNATAHQRAEAFLRALNILPA